MPGGTVGEFNAVERLGAVRRSLYEDISKVLVPPSVGLQEAENTNAYVGLEPEQYLLLGMEEEAQAQGRSGGSRGDWS